MLSEGGTPSGTKPKADDTSVPTMKWQDWMKTEPDKGRLELAIEIAERKQTMTDNDRDKRPFDPPEPKGSVSLSDYVGHIVGFFGCGKPEVDPDPKFPDNDRYVPVETLVIFKKPVSEGTEQVVPGWRCFNTTLRGQAEQQRDLFGLLGGKGRAGSPLEIFPLPDTDKGNAAYQLVIDEASKNGWIASEASSAKTNRKDDDDEF